MGGRRDLQVLSLFFLFLELDFLYLSLNLYLDSDLDLDWTQRNSLRGDKPQLQSEFALPIKYGITIDPRREGRIHIGAQSFGRISIHRSATGYLDCLEGDDCHKKEGTDPDLDSKEIIPADIGDENGNRIPPQQRHIISPQGHNGYI